MDECPICLCNIKHNKKYVVINNLGENGKYHPKCLKLWMKKSLNGILTDNVIVTYSIYKNDRYINTLSANNIRSYQLGTFEKDSNFIQLETSSTTQNNETIKNNDFECCNIV